MAKVKVAPFDASEYLDDEEVIAEYLSRRHWKIPIRKYF
jgi:DNA-binding phage protein